jgi:hypothetical protein
MSHTYALPRAVTHAATKRELVAKQQPPGWVPPLTEAEAGVEGAGSRPRDSRSRGIGHEPSLLPQIRAQPGQCNSFRTSVRGRTIRRQAPEGL